MRVLVPYSSLWQVPRSPRPVFSPHSAANWEPFPIRRQDATVTSTAVPGGQINEKRCKSLHPEEEEEEGGVCVCRLA